MTTSIRSLYKGLALLSLLFILSGCSNSDEPPQAPVTSKAQVVKVEDQRSPLYYSTDLGKTWQDARYNLPANVQVSFIESMGPEIVMATDNLGVFLSSQNRTDWKAINGLLPSKKINALRVAGERILVGPYNKGVFETSDKRANWVALNYDLPNLRVQAILVKANGVLLVGTDSGIYELDESAKKWTPLYEGVQVLSLEEYEGHLIAGTSQGTLMSTDEGQNWHWIHQEGAVHYTHLLGSTIVEMYIFSDLYFSSDWGATWIAANYKPRDNGSYVYEVAQLGEDFVLSNNYGIHHSSDQGKNWELLFPTEQMAFFDFLVIDKVLYGGTRTWDEYRKRKQ